MDATFPVSSRIQNHLLSNSLDIVSTTRLNMIYSILDLIYSIPNILNKVTTEHNSVVLTCQTEQEARQAWAKPIEKVIGYKFNDLSLLELALTHSSYHVGEVENRYSYERLEYLGDAVLGFMVTKHHYFTYPHLNQGVLTKLRSVNVDTEKLVRVAVKHKLYKFIRHNNLRDLASDVDDFIIDAADYPVHSSGLIDPPKVLADIVESLVGAIYLDSNSIDTTWMVVRKLLEPTISPENLKPHPMSMFNEMSQKSGLKLIFLDDLWGKTGEVKFVFEHNGEVAGSAIYKKNKQVARFRAAQNACNCDVFKQFRAQNI